MELATNIYQYIGVLGFILYMLSYFLLQIGKISGTGNCYILLNLGAASFVLISLLHQFNLASALIQVSWILISLLGLARTTIQKQATQSQAEYFRS